MSVYFQLLFLVLTIEILILFILILPLPIKIRKTIYSYYEKIIKNSTIKTILLMSSIIVGMLFIDSYKRSRYTVTLPHHKSQQHHHLSENDIDIATTPLETLVTRAYNQRNVYISGFILYFGFCIITIMNLIKKIINLSDKGTTTTKKLNININRDESIKIDKPIKIETKKDI